MKLLKTTAIAGLLAASGAASAIELSGNVALTSDYVWRGVSQTDGSPAIQGGFDADFGNGLYAGVWGSNVDFGGDENMEVDVYGGWAGEFEGVGVDVGVLHYHYPTSASGTNFTEVYLGLSYGPVSLTQSFGVKLGSDNIGDSDFGNYTDLGLDLGSYNDVAFGAHVGYYNDDTGNNLNNAGNGDDYYDWKLSASTSLIGADWELAYTDTDESDSNADAVILTISKSL